MKKSFFTIVLVFSISLISLQLKAQVYDIISMGSQYALDEYYSLENGNVKTVIRTDWDISFFTKATSPGISINGGAGIKLYVYPYTDTTYWNNVDTTGLSTWPELINSEDSWEKGAFVQNASGYPDYGWGVYDSITHVLKGDSIFIIKLMNGNFMKIWIVEKQTISNIYTFRFSNLDGSNEHTIILDCGPYVDKNFIYYSLENNTILDRDPTSDSWDFLFTKYNATQPNGAFYIVTGILTNVGIETIRMEGVDPAIENWGTLPFEDSISNIGFNWKYFDLGAMQYYIVDSLVYFVQNHKGDVYKLVFDGFDGMSTGNAYITKKLIIGVGVDELSKMNSIDLYPNPANESIFINIDVNDNSNAGVRVTDMLGHVVYTTEIYNKNAQLMIPVNTWNNGIYLVSVTNGDQIISKKIVINRK
jgi:hypothetical protein